MLVQERRKPTGRQSAIYLGENLGGAKSNSVRCHGCGWPTGIKPLTGKGFVNEVRDMPRDYRKRIPLAVMDT